jgi:prepilin-type N-terminal cleavage/methylation domain-containing protein
MKQRGFSLLELLVVMAVVITISAIAVPHLLRARITANETAAVANVRMLQDAQLNFSISHPDRGYTCSLDELGPAANGGISASNADLIDNQLTTGKKSGYRYEISGCGEAAPNLAYTITAVPEIEGTTGTLYYCVRQDGVIRYSATGGGTGCVQHGIPLLASASLKSADDGGAATATATPGADGASATAPASDASPATAASTPTTD